MFKDLDEQKLDYMLLDKTYANFYSKLINSKFYVMRQVERKRSFNVLLRGFNQEQLSCFQTTSVIISQLWIKSNLSFNANKVVENFKLKFLTTAFLAISPRFRSAPIATGTDRKKIARDEFYLISVLQC